MHSSATTLHGSVTFVCWHINPKTNLNASCHTQPEYPIKPPDVRFVTKLKHINVNDDGRICHYQFGSAYSASMPMKDILGAIHELLLFPQEDRLVLTVQSQCSWAIR